MTARFWRWWHARRQERQQRVTSLSLLSRRVDQLAAEFHVHTLTTDARMDVYDVLTKKVLADLNATLSDLARTQHRLADLIEGRGPMLEDTPVNGIPVMREIA